MSLDLNFSLDDFPWPDGTKRLFVEGGSNRDTAFLYPGTRTWVLYAHGYQTAYECLLESWNGPFKHDAIAYPAVFLCRQFIELSLKGVFCQCHKLLGRKIEKIKGHELDVWWKKLRPLLHEIFPNDPVETLNHVEKLILEFAELDNRSTAFRYPADLDGKLSLPDLNTLDVAALGTAMAQLSAFFAGVSSAVSEYLSNSEGSHWS